MKFWEKQIVTTAMFTAAAYMGYIYAACVYTAGVSGYMKIFHKDLLLKEDEYMMTLTEVSTEFKACEARVAQLQKEVLAESDKNIAMIKLSEMVSLAKRMSELDTLQKQMIVTKLAVERAKFVKRLRQIKTKAL